MRTTKNFVVAELKGHVSRQIINKPRILHSTSVWHSNTHSPVPYHNKRVERKIEKKAISLCEYIQIEMNYSARN